MKSSPSSHPLSYDAENPDNRELESSSSPISSCSEPSFEASSISSGKKLFTWYRENMGAVHAILIMGIIFFVGFWQEKEDSLIKEARKEFSQKNFSGALEKYHLVLKGDQNHPIALNDISLIYYEQKNYQLALDTIRRIPEKAFTSFQKNLQSTVYSNKCLYRFTLQDLENAVKDCDQALSLQPKNSMALNNKAVVYESLGKYQEALDLENQAILFWDLPENSQEDYGQYNMIDSAYTTKGLILIDLERDEEALEFLQKALDLNPKNAFAYNNKALALARLGKVSQALESIENAITLDPSYGVFFQVKGFILANEGRDEEALPLFEKAIALDPDTFVNYYSQALSLFLLERYDQALQVSLEGYKKEYSLSQKTYFNENTALICMSQVLTNHYSEALRYCDEYLKNYTDELGEESFLDTKVTILDYKGLALANLERYDEARELFMEANRLKPNDPISLEALGERPENTKN